MNHNHTAAAMSAQQSAAPATMPQTGNSFDIMRGYYLEKIQESNARLNRLNLMENAREISAICHEIIRAKKELMKLSMRKGYIA